MKDQELLELAAKAAGYTILQYSYNSGCQVGSEWWNPLTNDCDALRLAVTLSLEVSFDGDDEDGKDSSCSVGYPESSERPCRIKYVIEQHNKDIYSATRRAITRAAAEIGKGI